MPKERIHTTQAARPSQAAAHSETDASTTTGLRPPTLQWKANPVPLQRVGGSAEEVRKQTLTSARWAAQLYEAMDGMGTDEDAIYQVLRPLNRGQIKQLKETYQSVYSRSLLSHLRDELTNGELTFALQLMLYWPRRSGGLGSHQVRQAQEKMLNLPGYSLNTFTNLLDILGTAQRPYLYKAIAAGNSIMALIPFAYRIRGKNALWLRNHLHLTQQAGGQGIRQQWQMSCGPTTVQAVQGEMDPIYALRMNDSNPALSQVNGNNGMATNPNMAADQRSMLQSTYSGPAAADHAGVAAPVNNTNQALVRGRWVDDLLNTRGASAGVSYTHHAYGATATTFSGAVSEIDSGLEMGLPVPIVVGSAAAPNAHYVLVLSKSGNSYTIHDPGSGQSVTETRAALLNGTLSTIGSFNRIWAVETPSPSTN